MADPKTQTACEENPKVGFGAYIALALAIIIFSGVFYKMPDAYKWLGAFDYTTLIGKYGTIAGTASNFQGSGGFSARAGFLFSLNLFPGVMLAMGLIEVLSFYGALRAAQVILTPLLKPILGVPGYTGLALITDLQSTDGGAAIARPARRRPHHDEEPRDDLRLAVYGRGLRVQLLLHRLRSLHALHREGLDPDGPHSGPQVRGRRSDPHHPQHRLSQGLRK